MTVEAAILSSNDAMREGVGSWRLSPSMGLLGSRTGRIRSPSSAVRAPLGCCSSQAIASRALVGPLAPLVYINPEVTDYYVCWFVGLWLCGFVCA